jgi:ABC-type sugar transport system substrate-binding protein
MKGLQVAMGFLVLIGTGGVFVSGIDVLRGPQSPAQRLVMVMGGDGPFWQQIAAGAKSTAEHAGYQLSIHMLGHDGDLREQRELLDCLAQSQPDGIAIWPLDAARQQASLEVLTRHSKVVAFGRAPAEPAGSVFYVGQADFATGKLAAATAIEASPHGAKFLLVIDDISNESNRERLDGFTEELQLQSQRAKANGSSARWQCVDLVEDRGEACAAVERVQDVLINHPDLSCIVRLSEGRVSELALLAARAGQTGRINLVTCDQSAETLALVESGAVFAAVADDPYAIGRVAAMWLRQLCRSSELNLPVDGYGEVHVPSRVIRRGNLGELRTRLAASVVSPPAS